MAKCSKVAVARASVAVWSYILTIDSVQEVRHMLSVLHHNLWLLVVSKLRMILHAALLQDHVTEFVKFIKELIL